MATIKEKISEIMKASMKSGDKETLAAIRMLHAAVRKKEIDERVDCDDAACIKIIQTSVKQRQDAIEQFTTGGRTDLVEKETKELNLLMSFLPKQMTQEELVKVVEDSIKESGAATQKDMGALMKVLMPKVAGLADGKLVNQLVRERLK